MKDIKSILEEFSISAIKRAKALYFKPRDAIRLVDECERNQMAIIGLEGLDLRGEYIVPDMKTIVDLSDLQAPTWDAYVAQCAQIARRHLLAWSDRSNFVVDLTVTGGDRWPWQRLT